jgi:proline iminopeptidase
MDSQSDRQNLFPKIEPFVSGTLAAGGGHELYWEQSGNPDGFPVVFLHGGPGAGANPAHRRFFDPDFYRIVILDQRGAGRSRPYAALEENSTWHLVDDIEALRKHLGIDRWMVFGGSWGATLALAYGIKHPDRCAGFVLRGVFLGTAAELDWFLNGIRNVFPEAWRAFTGFLPKAERGDVLEGYYRRLVDQDPKVHLPAAEAWNGYETACSTLLKDQEDANGISGGSRSLAIARIEAHYFKHRMFLDGDYLLGNVDRVRGVPAVIVQGRYDMVCPIVTADRLAQAWPEATYEIVPDAGHSAMEPGIRKALVRATERLKGLMRV